MSEWINKLVGQGGEQTHDIGKEAEYRAVSSLQNLALHPVGIENTSPTSLLWLHHYQVSFDLDIPMCIFLLMEIQGSPFWFTWSGIFHYKFTGWHCIFKNWFTSGRILRNRISTRMKTCGEKSKNWHAGDLGSSSNSFSCVALKNHLSGLQFPHRGTELDNFWVPSISQS